MPRSKCDRCDEPHSSSECPAFGLGRHDHPDAQPLPHGDRPQITPASPLIEAAGTLIKQPGDGSCLYHSLICGEKKLGRRSCGSLNLREQLAAWIKRNGSVRFNGKTVEEWLQAEMGSTMSSKEYARRQSQGGWGGSMEILAFVHSKRTSVCMGMGSHQLRSIPEDRVLPTARGNIRGQD